MIILLVSSFSCISDFDISMGRNFHTPSIIQFFVPSSCGVSLRCQNDKYQLLSRQIDSIDRITFKPPGLPTHHPQEEHSSTTPVHDHCHKDDIIPTPFSKFKMRLFNFLNRKEFLFLFLEMWEKETKLYTISINRYFYWKLLLFETINFVIKCFKSSWTFVCEVLKDSEFERGFPIEVLWSVILKATKTSAHFSFISDF